MFSKIGELLSPLTVNRETKDRGKEKGPRKEGPPAIESPQEDVMFLSLEAVRAVLDCAPGTEADTALLELERNNIKHIPVRLEQEIYQALMEAYSLLKG